MNTQKHLLTALTFFTCVTTAIAQQQAPITSPASSAATIPKEYVSTDGRFKVLFPAKPKRNPRNY